MYREMMPEHGRQYGLMTLLTSELVSGMADEPVSESTYEKTWVQESGMMHVLPLSGKESQRVGSP